METQLNLELKPASIVSRESEDVAYEKHTLVAGLFKASFTSKDIEKCRDEEGVVISEDALRALFQRKLRPLNKKQPVPDGEFDRAVLGCVQDWLTKV